MKKLMKLRNKKGFTLVELIIVIAIIAILMACVAAFSGPVQKIVKSSAASADALQVNKIIGDYIENRLAYASYIDVHIAKNVNNLQSDPTVVGGTTGFTAIQNKLNVTDSSIVGSNANGKAKGGMLIFHYEPDADEPFKSTYKLYDIPIGNTGSYNATAFTGTKLNGAVFADGFYLNNSQLLILPEVSVVPNRTRNTLLMRLDIYPYSFDTDYYDASAPDTDNIYIKSDTLSDYYQAFDNAESASPGTGKAAAETAVLSTLSVKKTGTSEGVAFQLRNLDQKIKYDSLGNVVTNNWQIHGQDGGAGGSDIIIFYYIPHFGS